MREAWTEAALANRLGISRQTVRRWPLPPHDVSLGRSVGWWPETLAGWVHQHRPALAQALTPDTPSNRNTDTGDQP